MNFNRLLVILCLFASFTASSAILTVLTTGDGTVSPDLNGRDLQIGKLYAITARPGRGSVFSNWTGSVFTAVPTLRFVMQPGFTLQANFVSNPFVPRVGKYVGIFTDTNILSRVSSGFLTLNLSSRGTYSASLMRATNRYSFTGRFDIAGVSTKTIKVRGANPLQVAMQLDLGTNSGFISGTVSNSTWAAVLRASRIGLKGGANSALTLARRYTFVMPSLGSTNGSIPTNVMTLGDGYGTITTDNKGNLRVHGVLPDGQKFNQAVSVNANGEWPLFVSISSAADFLFGAMSFINDPDLDLVGQAIWISQPQPSSVLFTQGFTNLIQVLGSSYTPPARHSSILNLIDGVVTLEGGNLNFPITNLFALRPNNTIVDNGVDHLVLTFTPATGLFHGRVRTPDSVVPTQFQGTVLQKAVFGSGFFTTTNSTGRVTIETLGSLPGPLTVGIEAETLNAQAGQPVEFNAIFNEPISFSFWNFGDGTFVTNAVSATHSWAEDGQFQVTLTAQTALSSNTVTNGVIMQIAEPNTNIVSGAVSR
jgi:PKD domain-containing protein/List-Bact-rpt repeat protein